MSGVLDADAPCRCSRQVPYAIRHGMLDPERPRWVHLPEDAELEEVLALLDLGTMFRRLPGGRAPATLLEALESTLRG